MHTQTHTQTHTHRDIDQVEGEEGNDTPSSTTTTLALDTPISSPSTISHTHPPAHTNPQLPLPLASHVPLAAARGFIFHHAEPDYVMMTHWLDDHNPSTLPPGPTHQVRRSRRKRRG